MAPAPANDCQGNRFRYPSLREYCSSMACRSSLSSNSQRQEAAGRRDGVLEVARAVGECLFEVAHSLHDRHKRGEGDYGHTVQCRRFRDAQRCLAAGGLGVDAALAGEDEIGSGDSLGKVGGVHNNIDSTQHLRLEEPEERSAEASRGARTGDACDIEAGRRADDSRVVAERRVQLEYGRSVRAFLRTEYVARAGGAEKRIGYVTCDLESTPLTASIAQRAASRSRRTSRAGPMSSSPAALSVAPRPTRWKRSTPNSCSSVAMACDGCEIRGDRLPGRIRRGRRSRESIDAASTAGHHASMVAARRCASGASVA